MSIKIQVELNAFEEKDISLILGACENKEKIYLDYKNIRWYQNIYLSIQYNNYYKEHNNCVVVKME